MKLAPGTMVNANVRLIELIGRGGMGSVWIADHLGLECRVAVKFITPELIGTDPSLAERFKREARISAKLRSIHVVQTFDNGVMEDGRPYIVMELLEGQTLTDVVEEQGPRPLREVGVIVAQICKVLHRAHGLGIIHRDVKPDNIFISRESDYEMLAKVLDFGIAKAHDASGDIVTKTGAIVGSPEFMSPEQAINSKDVDYRSDLFSLGVVAYYALTGELPFDDDEDKPFWIQLSSGDFIPATKRRTDLRPDIDLWFKKALGPKPGDRFQSARELADALAVLASPSNSSALGDLSSHIDESVKLPDNPHDLKFDHGDYAPGEERTIKMHVRPQSDPAPMAPAVRSADVSGGYAPPVHSPIAHSPTVLSPPRPGEPPRQRPPWALTQAGKGSSSNVMIVAIVATLAVIAILAAIITLSWGTT